MLNFLPEGGDLAQGTASTSNFPQKARRVFTVTYISRLRKFVTPFLLVKAQFNTYFQKYISFLIKKILILF